MRAAIDFSLTPRLCEGVDGVEPGTLLKKKQKKTYASVERWAAWLYVTMQLQKRTHRHNIYTLTVFSACASKTKRERGGVCTVRAREERRGGDPRPTNVYVLWMVGLLPKRVGLNVCENTTPPSLGRHIFLHRWCWVFHPEKPLCWHHSLPSLAILTSFRGSSLRACLAAVSTAAHVST